MADHPGPRLHVVEVVEAVEVEAELVLRLGGPAGGARGGGEGRPGVVTLGPPQLVDVVAVAVDLEAQGVALHEDDVAAALVEEVLDRLDVGQGERPVAVTEGRDLERSVLR